MFRKQYRLGGEVGATQNVAAVTLACTPAKAPLPAQTDQIFGTSILLVANTPPALAQSFFTGIRVWVVDDFWDFQSEEQVVHFCRLVAL